MQRLVPTDGDHCGLWVCRVQGATGRPTSAAAEIDVNRPNRYPLCDRDTAAGPLEMVGPAISFPPIPTIIRKAT